MSIIGNNVTGGGVTFVVDMAELADDDTLHTTFLVDQNIVGYYIRQHSSSNDGKNAKLAVMDVLLGSSGSTIVAGTEQSFVGDNAGEKWIFIDLLLNPIALPAGTYQVQFWSDGWVGQISGDYINNRNIRVADVADLQSPFVLNNSSRSKGSVSAYVETQDAVTVTKPTISSVNGGNSIADGDSVTIVLANGLSGSNTVKIGNVDSYFHVDAVTQTITSDGNTSIDITVELPTGATSDNPVYVFVHNGTEASNGFSVNVTPIVSTLHTMVIEDGSSNAVICSSTNFALGVTAYKNKGLPNEEIASLITEVSNSDTSTPQYQVTFSGGEPVNGTDTITIVYDAGVGDIKSVTGSIALPSITFDSDAASVC